MTIDYFQCPRCHEYFSAKIELTRHLKSATPSCSNDYDNRPREFLADLFWRKPELFKVSEVHMLKEQIAMLRSEINALLPKIEHGMHEQILKN